MTKAATGPSRPLPGGTVAQVNGAIIAGGDARVRAYDDIFARSLAGSIAGGAVGVGQSVAIFDMTSHAEAQVSSTGSISSGATSADIVEVSAGVTEVTQGFAIGGATGAGAQGGQVLVLHSTADQMGAHRHRRDDPAGRWRRVRDRRPRRATSRRSAIGAGLGAIAVGSRSGDQHDRRRHEGRDRQRRGRHGRARRRHRSAASPSARPNNSTPTATSYSVQAGGGAAISGSVAVVEVHGHDARRVRRAGPLGVRRLHRQRDRHPRRREREDAEHHAPAASRSASPSRSRRTSATPRPRSPAARRASAGAVNVIADATNTAFAWAPAARVGGV